MNCGCRDIFGRVASLFDQAFRVSIGRDCFTGRVELLPTQACALRCGAPVESSRYRDVFMTKKRKRRLILIKSVFAAVQPLEPPPAAPTPSHARFGVCRRYFKQQEVTLWRKYVA